MISVNAQPMAPSMPQHSMLLLHTLKDAESTLRDSGRYPAAVNALFGMSSVCLLWKQDTACTIHAACQSIVSCQSW